MPVYQSAGVYVVEKDLSQVVPTTSTSTGAIVLHAKRGPINTPVLVTNTQEFISTFGNPHPTQGFGAYASLAFLERSNQLYVVRIVEGAYAYAGVKVGTNLSGNAPITTKLGGVSGGTNPEGIDFDTVVAPTAPGLSQSTGGALTALETYQYQVTALNAYGEETTAAVAASLTLGAGNQTISLAITRVEGATGYKVYRQAMTVTPVAQRYITTVAQPTTGNASYVDAGAIVGTGTQSPPLTANLSEDAFFVYCIGPGAYGNGDLVTPKGYQIAITSSNLLAPTFSMVTKPVILTATAGGTGGTIAAGDYTYQVTAVDALGNETSALTATAVAGVTLGQNVTVTLTAAVNGAVAYRLYREKTNATTVPKRYLTTFTGLVYVDTGAIIGSDTQSPPATGTLSAATYYFKVTAVNSLGQETDSGTGLSYVVAALGDRPIINIARVEGAMMYRIYGRPTTVNGTYELLTTVNQELISGANPTGLAAFVDEGTITATAVNPPAANFAAVPEFKLAVYDLTYSSGAPVEEYTVTMNEKLDGFGQQMEIETRINTFSKLIRVVKNDAYVGGDYGFLSAGPGLLAGGADGDEYSNISASAFVNGWNQFIDPEVITVRILIEGGTQQAAVQLKMNSVAQTRKDCFCVMDIPTAYQDPTQAVVYRRDILNMNSNRAAIYTPDLRINDPYNDLVIYVPPSGHVAAVFAFTDFTSQVWYAPAGLNRGSLNVLGVRYKYNQAQRDILAPVQVNYVRNFPGLGLAVWEQTTLQSKTSALSFINVRRMLDTIEVSVSQALLFSNYEPNDDFLKRQIVTLISQFLEVIKNGRGIADYAVISDSSNNPPQIANIGQLNVDVYIQPILPARVIQLQMIITKQGVSFQELIANGGNV